MKKIAIYNNKGGCGKTTSVINLAYAFGEMNKRTLVLDCDNQQNSLRFFAEKARGEIQRTRYPNIDVSAWSDDALRQNCDYDYALLDLPPTLDGRTREILGQCDHVFVPIELSPFSVYGVAKVTELISEVGTDFGGCYVSRYNKRNPASAELLEMLRTNFGDKMIGVTIPQSNVIMNSILYRQTAFEYMKWLGAVVSLGDLAEEILERTAPLQNGG
ncbi:chromosome partitioning protein Soj [Clostridia bacterium]|nr:chromosome partitioning protein Soj [Clostridia bacterium]